MAELVQGKPLLEVAPIELPPPAASPPRAPSLALRALVSVGLLVGLFVVAFGLVVGLIGVNLLVLQTGRVVIALFLLTVAVVLSVARGLVAMLRKPSDPSDEVEVPAAQEPEVHERLRQLAGVVGTRPPDRVVVTSEVNAYVSEFGPLMGLVRGRRTLAIGTPLLDVLTVAQLDAVLAHELGHLAGGDTRLGPLAFRTDQATARMITSLRGHFIASVFVAYWKFQHRVSATVRRGQELVADRAAVRAAGRQAAADALHRVEIASRAEEVYREDYLAPLLGAGCRPVDLTLGLREILREPQRVAQLSAVNSSGGDRGDPWATHPPTAERIARVAALSDPAGLGVDERPARALWRDADGWSHQAHEVWLNLLIPATSDLRVVDWDRFGEETAGRAQRSRAEEVDRALGQLGLPVGIDGVRQALDSGRGGALAGELVALGWRAPGGGEREAILNAAVAATSLRAALDGGVGQLRFSWSEPLLLADHHGEPIPLGDLSLGAVAGEWAPLQNALAQKARRRPLVTRRPAPEEPDAAEARQPDGPGGPALPAPPAPPFRASTGAWLWELQLPGRLGRKTRLAIGEAEVGFGDAAVSYDDIESVSMKNGSGDSNLRITVTIRRTSGKPLELRVAALRNEGKAAIQVGIDYLWWVLRQRVGPRLRASIVAALETGAEVQVGGLNVSKAGLASGTRRTRQVPWSEVVGTVNEGGSIQVFPATGKPIQRPLSSENAFLLEDLIPELQARYG